MWGGLLREFLNVLCQVLHQSKWLTTRAIHLIVNVAGVSVCISHSLVGVRVVFHISIVAQITSESTSDFTLNLIVSCEHNSTAHGIAHVRCYW